MNSQANRYLTDLMQEVAAASPEPPPWPGGPVVGLAPVRGRRWTRLSAMTAAFVLIVGLIGVTTLVIRTSTNGPGAGAVAVMIETGDGVVLHGQVWDGSSVGIVLVGAYGAAEDELVPIIEPLALRGHTVLTYDLRGQGRSEGVVTPALLDEDLRESVAYLRDRGMAEVYVAAYRHSGAAAIAAAGRGDLPIDGLVGLFPLNRYLEQDAVAVVGDIQVPFMLVGSVGELPAAAPDATLFRSIAPDPEIFRSSGPQIAEFIQELVAFSGS